MTGRSVNRPRWTWHGEGPAGWPLTASMAIVLVGVGISIAAQDWAVLPWKAMLLLALWEVRYWRNRAAANDRKAMEPS